MSNKYALLFLLLFCSLMFSAQAQAQTLPASDSLSVSPETDSPEVPAVPLDSIQQDSIQKDSLLQDTLRQDTTALKAPARKSDIETTIRYNARDSIRLDFKEKTMYMYGTQPAATGSGNKKGNGGAGKPAGSDAKIEYGQIKLEAAYITTNWETHMLTANTLEDSAGRSIGKPVFTDGPEQFVTDNIRYNFKTKKAIIKGIVTQQQDAYIHGETVKKTAENELLIENARYTTCNLEDPHFHIEAKHLKVLPGDKIISGPFHLKIADVSTPLGFLFGMFPAPKKRVSGVIIPKYGEERKRGFFLRDGGYYWAVNDYMDLTVTGEIFSKGSYGGSLGTNYRKRYAYNGTLNFRYNRLNVAANEATEEYSTSMWLNWSHAPQTKGKGRFSASVNGGTSNYISNNPSVTDLDRNLQQDLNSNISYSYSNIFGLPLSFSSRASLNQQIETRPDIPSRTDLVLPDVSLMMSRQFPFKRQGSMGKTWWEQISVGYTFKATNRITNKPATRGTQFLRNDRDIMSDSLVAFNFDNLPLLLERGKMGAHHSIPIGTSFNILKHFQVSPNFNYNEYWFREKLNYTYVPEEKKIAVDTLRGFHRAGVYSTGASVGTKVFGTFYFNKRNPQPKIQAMRHMIIPSVGINYSPDFTSQQFGYFQEVQTGIRNEEPVFQTYSVFQGAAYSVPGGKESANISFSLNNSLEMKVRTKGDTANPYKKVSVLRSLSFNTSYNIIAEEFKLQPLSISGSTSLLNNLINISFGGTLNPYIFELDSVYYTNRNNRSERVVVQTLVDEYAWDHGKGIGKLERLNFQISTSLSPATFKGGTKKPVSAVPGVNTEAPTASIEQENQPYIYDDPNEYVDFNLPWTLRFNYSFNYSKPGFADSKVVQSTNFNGDVNVTEKWKIGFRSSYDIKNNKFVQTSFDIYRDLHCWQMRVSWIPFGYSESFSVDINVKSPTLQDLKLSRRRSWFDN